MGRAHEHSLNGSSWPGRTVPDVDTLARLVAGESRRATVSPEDPARAGAEDLELLQRVHALGPLGPFATVRNRAAVGRLVREGLLTLDGLLASAGEEFMRPISTAHEVLAVRGRCGGRRTLLQGWISGPDVAVVSGPAGPDLMAAVDRQDGREYAVMSLDRGSLASLVCQWAGVRTFPAALPRDLLLPEELFTQRVADGCAPVPDPEQLEPVPGEASVDHDAVTGWWGAPWFTWEVTSARHGVNLGLISAQAAGNYVFGGDPAASERAGMSMVRVAPVSAQSVWEALWLLTHGGGAAGAAGRPVLGGTPRRGPLGEAPVLPRSVD